MDSSYIGVTSFGTRNKKNYHYVKSEHEKGGKQGGVNPYRVFPPYGTLAADGRVYEYWGHHEVVNTKGERRSFACIEEMDWQTKMVKVHCPFCEMHKRNKAQYDTYKTQGAASEDLKAFNTNHVQPYQSQNRYYVNAINLEGQIGVLALPSKLFKDFKALYQTYANQGFDITGTKGMFLNFQKISQYKGDNQPIFKVDLLRDVAINPATGMPEEKMRPPHELTPEIVARMKTECFELSTLYKKITPDQMGMILQATGPQRAVLVDQIFALPERQSQSPENDPSKVRIGNSDMYAVGHLNHTPTGPELVMPNFNGMGDTTSAAMATIPSPTQAALAPAQPLAAPTYVAPPLTQPAPAAPVIPAAATLTTPANTGAMTDEQFRATFGNM
jgi:hypothetical protein